MKVFEYGCKHWSAFDDKVLRELHEERRPVKDISRTMYRTAEAIRHRKKHLGLHRILRDDIANIVRRAKNKRRRAMRCGE